jgi:hypothetical protein
MQKKKMSESEKESEARILRELEGKNVAHYSVLLGAWIQTKMERDKTLVTLSAAAIGLLVTILTTVGVKSIWEVPMFALAVSSFLVTIWSSLVIYQLNSQHLEDAIRGSSKKDPRLEKYDKRAIRAFIIGAVSALIIGILSASTQLHNHEENHMTNKETSSQNEQKLSVSQESFDGVANLSPNATMKKSLNGITNLSPQATQKPAETQGQGQGQGQGQSGSAGNNDGSDGATNSGNK